MNRDSSDTNAAFAGTSSSNGGAFGEGAKGCGRFLGVIVSSQAMHSPSPYPLGGSFLDYSELPSAARSNFRA